MKIYIIIPAYNEASVIADTISDVHKYCSNTSPSPPSQGGVRGGSVIYQTIVIDDGSADNTYESAKRTDATVLRHIINRGQGAALRTGINYALECGADIIVTYDADGQFEAGEIKKLSQPIIDGLADIVLGSRFLSQEHCSKFPPSEKGEQGGFNNIRENPPEIRENHIPLLKKLILIPAIYFTRAITGLNLTDTHNGFRAFSRKAAQKIKIRQDRMAHASEIVHEIARLKLRYKELPITVKYTPYSRRKGQPLTGAFKILFDLVVK